MTEYSLRANGYNVERIPLTLYVHTPWCVRKCPYCDFNSHEISGDLPERRYLSALLSDLDSDAPLTSGRELAAIFIGGGTPSLCSGKFFAALLTGIGERVSRTSDVEITLEANPGTITERYLGELREAGVNRLSVGVQSLNDTLLSEIGRIHDAGQARDAVAAAKRAGFEEINVDLMFGLPGQTLDLALKDVEQAMSLAPAHISYYQLTLESGTPFARQPPPRLPDEDRLWEMQRQGAEALEKGGYARYEISAYARADHQCRHNRNYWEFGDYLGIGAGAHGKLTIPGNAGYLRTRKTANPSAYQRWAGTDRCGSRHAERSESNQVVEFLLNALRLVDGFPLSLYAERTGRAEVELEELLGPAAREGLISLEGGRVRPSARGLRYLDDLLARIASRVDR